MTTKKKYPEIKPQYIIDASGKTVGVCLPYKVYESILEEIAELKAELMPPKKKVSK